MCRPAEALARERRSPYRRGMRTPRFATLLALTILATGQLAAQSPSITVIAAPGFRARPIRQHQLSWQVAFDTAAGGIVAQRVALGLFTFGGTVRVDGIAPYAREAERAGYADSARFVSDGRVVLAVADSAAAGPIQVEPRGIAGANAGRLLLGAAGWPIARVVVVTLEPLDLFVTAGGAGFGERDRVRLDDVAGVAYVSDPAASPAVVAIALGRGARGRMQTGIVETMVERNYDGAVGRERRNVNRLVLYVEPDRTGEGAMSAEILFGLGRSEAEALEAARGGSLGVPAAAAVPRITTPLPEIALALGHLAGTAAWIGGPAPWVSPDPTWPRGDELWRQLGTEVRRLVTRDYGRPDSAAVDFTSLRTRLVEGLFGIEHDGDRLAVAPRLDGIADTFTWRVDGLRVGSDSLALAYRPADRRVTVTVGAARRVRLSLRFLWLSGASCVTMRRGQWPVERLPLVMMTDGTGYVDVRSGYDPAAITVTAAGCGG